MLKQHREQVRDCIEKHERSGGSSGLFEVTLDVLPSGRVAATRFEPSTVGGEVLGKCVASNAKSWKFPAFSGSKMPVRFPLRVK